MYRKLITTLFVPLLVATASPLTAFAEGAFEDLTVGDTLPEVMRVWGQPAEKINRDVKREVRWNYSQSAFVVFKDGKVIDWRSSRGRTPESLAKKATATKAPDTERSPESSAMGDLVRDIAREVPGGPDAPYSEPPQGGLVPNQIPPQPPGGRSGPDEGLDPSEADQ